MGPHEVEAFRAIEHGGGASARRRAANLYVDRKHLIAACLERMSRSTRLVAYDHLVLLLRAQGEPGVRALISHLDASASILRAEIILRALEKHPVALRSTKVRVETVRLALRDPDGDGGYIAAQVLGRVARHTADGQRILQLLVMSKRKDVARAARRALRRQDKVAREAAEQRAVERKSRGGLKPASERKPPRKRVPPKDER